MEDNKTEKKRFHKEKKKADKKVSNKPKSRSERNAEEIHELNERSLAEAPPTGKLIRADGKVPKMFSDLPLSQYTMSGLERGKFIHLTKIQRLAIPHALAGRDILGAARTGSGKTLAFLVPVLERLYRSGWSAGLGLGAVMISPTRELAVQIYEVLRVVAYRHGFPIGLMIGGSDFKKEQQHAHQISAVVCTPGRLLQHLEQTPMVDAGQAQMLVLDEADRLLDLGFKEQLKQILSYLPQTRQTLLFSATQTKSVKALAKLSLRSPEYVSVLDASDKGVQEESLGTGVKNDSGVAPTPSNLVQAYTICQLPAKLDLLYSFIRSHLKSRIIVFFSSCKQVKYVDQAFRKLRPGIPLMCIHGKVKQQRRMYTYYEFINKPAAVLFATDIAARGLDFPSVDWVVQVDCPEDVATYIHRVGRTARYTKRGRALLFLLPNEAEGMVPLLKNANIPIVEKKTNPGKQQSIQNKLTGLVAQDTELQMNAQRAFRCYMRSVYLQNNKDVFDVKQLPMGAFAQSLGLGTTPRIKFAGPSGEKGREELRKQKNMPHQLIKLNQLPDKDIEDDDEDVMKLLEKLGSRKKATVDPDAEEDEEQKEAAQKKKKKNKWERLLALKASDPVTQSRLNKKDDDDDAEEESDADDLLVHRGTLNAFESTEDGDDDVDMDDLTKKPSKKQKKHLRIDATGTTKGRVRPKRVAFDEEGNVSTGFARLAEELAEENDDVLAVSNDKRAEYLQKLKEKLQAEDSADRALERERVKAKHLKERLKRRAENTRVVKGEGEQTAVLGGAESYDDDEGSSAASSGGEDEDEQPEPKPKRMKTTADIEQAALNLISSMK